MLGYDNEGATISMEDVRDDQASTLKISTIEEELAARRFRMLKPQKSTVASRRQQAVCVRRAYKKYGTNNNPNVILDGLNMTVPKGAIYGLLGASGCGKTTLLSCIVGRRRLDSGELWVLGGKPGSPGSGVPGPRIGYMPQETALFGEFSIRETMIYFGWIAGMTTKEVDERIDFLLTLLQLPNPTRQVKNLSGGQQRRVSLAAALLHQPELLILDEPTVGVDPVLRQRIKVKEHLNKNFVHPVALLLKQCLPTNHLVEDVINLIQAGDTVIIWDHLVEITKVGKTTVIITTHYIDETKQANIIGLMRGGRFLAEESPMELITRYNGESLEDVFLKLSVLQNRGKRRRSSILADIVEKVEIPSVPNPIISDVEDPEIGEISGEFGDNVSMSSKGRGMVAEPFVVEALPPEEKPPRGVLERIKPMKVHHMQALIWKNFWSLFRNYGLLAFIMGLPLSQIILFCLAIGHYPVGLPIAVVNYEVESNSSNALCQYDKYTCPQDQKTWEWNLTRFSCRYLDFLSKRQNNLIAYPSRYDAMRNAERDNVRAILIFQSNFSHSLEERMRNPRHADSYTLMSSDIEVHMDDTDKQVEWMLNSDIQKSFMDATQQLAQTCYLPSRILSTPIYFNKPIFGLDVPNFTDFAGPGVILTIIFFLAVALTSGSMLAERNEGILERSLVSGITGTEILFAHVIVQMLVMAAQTVTVLVIGFVVFHLTIRGPLVWVIVLTLINGLCGMTFGFVVSCICDKERTATYLALGSFLPMMLLCGIIWPVEGMHSILQYISYVLPLTKSTESLRSMLQRGWSITVPTVYAGFISTSVWIVIYLTLSILLIKFKKG